MFLTTEQPLQCQSLRLWGKAPCGPSAPSLGLLEDDGWAKPSTQGGVKAFVITWTEAETSQGKLSSAVCQS